MSILKLKPSCKDYIWGGGRLKIVNIFRPQLVLLEGFAGKKAGMIGAAGLI